MHHGCCAGRMLQAPLARGVEVGQLTSTFDSLLGTSSGSYTMERMRSS